MIEVRLKLYGAFKEFGDEKTIKIVKDSKISDLRKALKDNFLKDQTELLDASAISDDNNILEDNYMIQSNQVLSLLPPVCGG